MLHKYTMNGFNIVLDVNSGAVHWVDDVTFNILDYYKSLKNDEIIDKFKDTYSKTEVEQVLQELEQLEKNETLFSLDIYEEMAAGVKKRNPVVKALCLHVAHDCNLKCKYCFAEEGEYGGRRALMSAQTGKNALDFLVKNSANRKNLEVDFFGGEPLMNFAVVKEIVSYGKSIEKQYNKNFRFTITTNGMLLNDEIIDYLNEDMHNVVISLDGRKETNDDMRQTVNNKGSYDHIVPKFQKLAQSRNQKDYYIRGTFTRKNIDFAKDVLHMADLGFMQVSVEPVVGSENEDYTLRQEDVEAIYEEYKTLAKQILDRKKDGKDFNFFHFMIDLTGGPCAAKRLAGCGAGTEYLAVTPEGHLYPCHQFVGYEQFKMGTVEDGVNNFERFNEFNECNIYAKDDCKNCWAKFYCSGGCAANAYQANGNILEPYSLGCDLQRKRTECAIMMKVAEISEEV